jgi:HEAT repeat protein
MMVGRGGAIIKHDKREELMSLSQRFELLSNRELIAKIAREGGKADFESGLEHNMATLILETRKEKAVPALSEALADDPSPMAREAIAYALGRIGLASALPALEEAAQENQGRVKAAAEYAIGQIKEKNKE